MMAPRSRRDAGDRWRQPGALLGLSLLALGYWGTVALFTAHRAEAPPLAPPVMLEVTPPFEWKFQRRFNFNRPCPRLLPDDSYRWVDPAWSPYTITRPIGLAYGTPRTLLLNHPSR
jgi:hypothetical protein